MCPSTANKAKDRKTGQISYIGDVFGTQVGKFLLEHATQVDSTLHMVQFIREGGKPVVISNFRGHPHFDGGGDRYDLSADFIGAYRRALELMEDCHVLYLQGASGNVNTSTRFEDERRFTNRRSHGLALAAYGAECLARFMIEAKPGPIRTKQVEMWGDPTRIDPELLEGAKYVTRLWNETYDERLCTDAAMERGMRSSYQALAIVGNANRPKEDYRMVLNAIAVGDDLSFVTFPGELFDSLGATVEDRSPFRSTLVLGYAHHQVGYLPSLTAHRYTSYETDITRFAPGTGEKVVEQYLQMLNEMKG